MSPTWKTPTFKCRLLSELAPPIPNLNKKNQEIRKPTVRLFDTNGPQALINAFPWTSILTQIPSHHLKTENQKQKEQELYKVPPKHI